MSLYGRLMGAEDFKIPVHQFSAILAEFARGQLTGTQAQAAVNSVSGAPLTPGEVTEAQTLLATVTSQLTLLLKLGRAKEIDDVLMLAEVLAPPYGTPQAVQARLGT